MRQVGLAVATAVLACGCNAILGIDDLQLRDGAVGDDVDSSQTVCYGTYVRACLPEPKTPLMLSGMLDTSTDPRCTVIKQTGGPDVCAIAGTAITVSGATEITGQRALMLISTTTISVSAKLDASSSNVPAHLGPGANAMQCAPPVNGNSSQVLSGGGGGAGGSFITMGGGGGSANGGGGGQAVSPTAAQTTSVLRGGCAGGQGGSSGAGGLGGTGGAGGGAIYLVAHDTITIAEALRAGGAAGHHGSPTNGGGGGGGSGGMVVLEATTITVAGALAQIQVNGAGGGEASRTAVGVDGKDDRNWDQVPIGGSGGSPDGGDGGNGAYQNMPAGGGGNGGGGGGGGAGGGGGGGGIGAVRYKGVLQGASISPVPVAF